jgi:hypothetical protein
MVGLGQPVAVYHLAWMQHNLSLSFSPADFQCRPAVGVGNEFSLLLTILKRENFYRSLFGHLWGIFNAFE